MRRYRYHLSYDDMNHDVMNVAIVRRHFNTSVWWLKILFPETENDAYMFNITVFFYPDD
jgi:hypothetical protein